MYWMIFNFVATKQGICHVKGCQCKINFSDKVEFRTKIPGNNHFLILCSAGHITEVTHAMTFVCVIASNDQRYKARVKYFKLSFLQKVKIFIRKVLQWFISNKAS